MAKEKPETITNSTATATKGQPEPPKHKVTLIQKRGTTTGGFNIRLAQMQILVDGIYVGYCSTKPNGGIFVPGQIPSEIKEAVTKKVAAFWKMQPEEIKPILQLGGIEEEDQTPAYDDFENEL